MNSGEVEDRLLFLMLLCFLRLAGSLLVMKFGFVWFQEKKQLSK